MTAFGKRVVLFSLVALALLVGGGFGAYTMWNRTRPMHRAEQALAQGRFREALIELRSVSRDEPRNSKAHMMMAFVHEQLGDILAAERELKRARALGADRWEVLGKLNLYYLSQRRFRELLGETPSTGPTPAVVGRNLAFRSRAFTGQGDLRQAEEALKEAVRVAPENAEVQVAVARLALAHGTTGPAEAAIEAALKADPANLEALQVKFNMLAARGDVEGARTVATRAVDAAPGAAAPRLDRAGLLLAIGEEEAARKDVELVLQAQPRNAAAIYLGSVVSLQEQRFDEAAERLRALGDTGARFARTSYFQAMAALAKNLPATAVEAADRYVGRNPDDPDGVRLLARARTANNRPDLARDLLVAAIGRGMDDARTLDLLGTTLATIGDLDGAAAAYEKALAKAPDQPEIQIHLADLQVRQGNPAGAVQALERTAKSDAARSSVQQSLALAQIVAGQLDAAGATIARLRAIDGETEAVGNLAGMLALARLDVEGAVATFSATLRTFPDSTTVALNLARALAAGGKRADARTTIAGVLARNPRNPAAVSGFVQLCLADGQFPPAVRAVEAARAVAPDDDGLLAMLADVIVRLGDPNRAISAINRARPPESRTPPVWLAVARAQAAAGQVETAQDSLRRALEGGPNPAATLALAALQVKAGQAGAAARSLDEGIAQTPGDFELMTRRVQLEAETAGLAQGLAKAAALRAEQGQMPTAAVLAGDLLMLAKRPPEAMAAFRKEWEAAPSVALAVRLGEAQLASGDEAGAARTLQTVAEDPSAALLMSQMDIRAQRWPEAARNLELALAGRPGDPAVMNNLAFAYQRIDDRRARPTAQRAYLLDPSADNADTLGWILVGEGAAKEAVPILRAALRQRPGDGLVTYHLAAALEGAGEKTEAVPLLTALLAKPGVFDDRAAAEALLKRLQARL